MAKVKTEVMETGVDNRRTVRIDPQLWAALGDAAERESLRTGGKFTASGLVRKFCLEGLERLRGGYERVVKR